MLRLLTTVIALAALALTSHADEEIPLDKAPPAAVKAMKDKYPKGQVVKVEKEDDDGKPVIEFTLKEGDRKMEAEFTPDGKFVKEEAEITEKDVPAAVLKAFKQKYPDAKPAKTEKITKGDGAGAEVKYEFDIVDGGKDCEVFFSADGKFLEKKDSKEEKKPEKK